MDSNAPQKPIQPQITVSELLTLPGIAQVIGRQRWTTDMRNGVAEVLRNRRFIDRTGATELELEHFEGIQNTVQTLLEGDKEFAAAMDPCYIMVQFPSGGAPAEYRQWLDLANSRIGGTAFTDQPAGDFIVDGSAENREPLSLMDPTLQNLNLLMVNTEENAHFVAGQLCGRGLHAWVVTSEEPAQFR